MSFVIFPSEVDYSSFTSINDVTDMVDRMLPQCTSLRMAFANNIVSHWYTTFISEFVELVALIPIRCAAKQITFETDDEADITEGVAKVVERISVITSTPLEQIQRDILAAIAQLPIDDINQAAVFRSANRLN